MADFCRGCTKEEMREKYADKNDLVIPPWQLPDNELVWQLCEGCGAHLFDNKGQRYCHAKSWYEDQEHTSLFDCVECHGFVFLLVLAGCVE